MSEEGAAAPLLEVENLEVVYHSVMLVLKGVSLRVGPGEVVALLGPNGAGKTTLLRAVTGLLALHEGAVTKGRVSLAGDDLTGHKADAIVRRGVAQVMEGRRIFGDLTVEENLHTGAVGLPASTLRERSEAFYERFPILAKRRKGLAGYLSGGEQQMLSIARALMSRPRLLLLDEPSLGLAPQVIGRIEALIRQVHEDGVAVLLIEQNASLALALADRGYVLENGRVVLDGSSEELLEDKDIQEFYLGMSGDDHTNFRQIKHYRRRKRWLS